MSISMNFPETDSYEERIAKELCRTIYCIEEILKKEGTPSEKLEAIEVMLAFGRSAIKEIREWNKNRIKSS